MTRSRALAFILLAFVILIAGVAGIRWLASAPAPQPVVVARSATFYYLDPQAMYLVPVERAMALPAGRDAALERALQALTESPPGLLPPLPEGAQVMLRSLQDGKAIVSVRLAGSPSGSGPEQLMAGALVRTAASVGQVKELSLSLEDPQGTPYESGHLDLTRPLSPSDPGMENVYLGGDEGGLAVTVYFCVPETHFLVPLRMPLPAGRAAEPLLGGFSLLLAGPPADQQGILQGCISPATELRWNGVENGVAQVLWKNAPEATPSAEALRALIMTVTESGQVRAVRLTREGVPLEGKVGPFDLSQPLARPTRINPLAARSGPPLPRAS